MPECRTCRHRTAANSCAHLLAEVGGIHWCDMISECDMHAPIDNTAAHLDTMTRLSTLSARRDYLANVERSEGIEARQRLAEAFSAWWLARHPPVDPTAP